MRKGESNGRRKPVCGAVVVFVHPSTRQLIHSHSSSVPPSPAPRSPSLLPFVTLDLTHPAISREAPDFSGLEGGFVHAPNPVPHNQLESQIEGALSGPTGLNQ